MPNQQPKLHPFLERTIENGIPICNTSTSYAPDVDFAKLITAGFILRRSGLDRDPALTMPLSDQPLRQVPNESALQSAFRTVVNDSLDPQEPRGYYRRHYRGHETLCSFSEISFGHIALDALAGRVNEHGFRIITQEERPILLQKNERVRSGLSLEQLTIDGVRYPAGSIFGIQTNQDRTDNHGRPRAVIAKGRVQTMQDTDLAGLAFLRPSLLTLTPEDRASYLHETAEMSRTNKMYYPESLELLSSLTLDETTQAVTALV